ncbi:MAG: hypothetical protein V1816_19105 [Pseudomonadota bacterium]
MKTRLVMISLFCLALTLAAGPAFAFDTEDFWNGVTHEQLVREGYRTGAKIAPLKEKGGWFGPSAEDMAESYRTGTPGHKTSKTDWFGYPEGSKSYTAF